MIRAARVISVGVLAGRLLPLGQRLGVIVQQIKAFDVDEQRPIVGRAGSVQNADHLERIVRVAVRGAVCRLERAAHGQTGGPRATDEPMTAVKKSSD